MRQCKIALRVMARRHRGINSKLVRQLIGKGILRPMVKLAHAIPQGHAQVRLEDHIELLSISIKEQA